MTTPLERTRTRSRTLGRRAAMAAWLLLSLLCWRVPPETWQPVRDLVHQAIYPGQRVVCGFETFVLHARHGLGAYLRAAGDVANQSDELARLQAENRRLRELLTARDWTDQNETESISWPTAGTPGLLRTDPQEARLLGFQARACLARYGWLEMDRTSPWHPGDFALEGGIGRIDLGGDVDIRDEELLVSGRRIWGRVSEIGRRTSRVVRVDSPEFRALVILATDSHATWQRGPRGVLEGCGDGQCEVRFVAATEPVAEGDLVLAAETEGVLDVPLLIGRIVSAKRTVGAAHWEIRVRPAVSERWPRRLTLLPIVANPERGSPL